jgi:phosphoserine phosphatase
LYAGEIQISNISANELEFDEDTSTGKMILNVETAVDKLRHLVQILDHLKGSDPGQQQVHSVYVGDSLTDLLCLLRADVGIILGDSSTLKQVYGKKMTSLFRKALALEQASYLDESQKLSGCVFTVSSWYELEAFLLGPAKATVL